MIVKFAPPGCLATFFNEGAVRSFAGEKLMNDFLREFVRSALALSCEEVQFLFLICGKVNCHEQRLGGLEGAVNPGSGRSALDDVQCEAGERSFLVA